VLAAFLITLLSAPLRASEIPLGTNSGVYTVPVQINRSINLEFVVDPGAAVVVIPTSVFRALVTNRTLTQDDILGISAAELADRSSYRAVQVRLRELKISNTIVHNVIASVSPELTLPLLGQSFLSRFSLVTFDNERHVLILSNSLVMPQPRVSTPQVPGYAPFSAGALPSTTNDGSLLYGSGSRRPYRGDPLPPP
jgi:hypothetical protein